MSLRPDITSTPDMEVIAGSRYSSAYQLNPLWERVVKTQKLPPEVDLQEVLAAFKHRLRDPEKEVRQHALRVLIDLIPVLRSSLDVLLSPLLQDLIQNLGHSAPAVRKGSLDALRMYMSHSDNKEYIISEICTKCLEKSAINDTHHEDITTGVILALPSLLQPIVGFLGNSSDVIGTVIKALSSKLYQMIYQEVAIRSLVRIKELIGKKQFEEHIRKLDSSVVENYNLLCNIYDLGSSIEIIEENVEEIEDVDITNHDSDSANIEKTEEFFISEPPSQLLESENTNMDYPPTIKVDVDKTDVIPNGKIILETEISFDSQTAITMTILEEEDHVLNTLPESEDDAFDYTTYNKSVVKVLTDSEVEEHEDVRRTPRRVRFGGEIVKMRTPDSDTLHNSDADEIIEVNKDNKEPIKIVEQQKIKVVEEIRKEKETDKKEISEQSGSSKKNQSHKSMIPIPVEPITTRPKARKTNISIDSESKRKSKSLNDLSLYCKQQLGLNPDTNEKSEDDEEEEIKNTFARTKRSFIPLKSFSKDDVRLDEPTDVNKKTKSFIIAHLDNPVKVLQTELRFSKDDYNLSSSSTGSGSSSDNAVDDALEELNIFSDEVFKDFYKMEGQRGAYQVIERLTARLNNNPDFGKSLDSQQIKMLINRLGTLAGKTRGRAGETAIQALRALVRSASDKALKNSIVPIAGALAGAGLRCQGLLTDVGRRVSAPELVEALLDEGNPHWRSTKLRAGALRAVSYAVRTLPCSGVRITLACSRCAACARSPRRRVRAAALDTLATLARLCSPRSVLAAVHREAADHEDGDQLYDAVLARLCRPAAPGASPVIPVRNASSGNAGQRRPDVAWVMAGVGDASPPPSHKVPKGAQGPGDEWIYRARGGSSVLDKSLPSQFIAPLYASRITPTADNWTQQIHKWESQGQHRVVTAPPVALRPITLPTLAPPGQLPSNTRAVLWASPAPSQIDIHWTAKQEPWPPLGGSWPRHQQQEPPETRPRAGQQHQHPSHSHSQAQGRWGWGHHQGLREDGFSPHEASPQPHRTPHSQTHSNSEGQRHLQQQQHYPTSAILLTIRNKIDEHGEGESNKSDLHSTLSVHDVSKSPTGSTASLAVSISSPKLSNKMSTNGSIASAGRSSESRVIEMSPGTSPRHMQTLDTSSVKSQSREVSPAHSNHTILSHHTVKSYHESSPFREMSPNRISPSRIQRPPTIEDNFDDDDGVAVMTPQRSKSPSPHRFIERQDTEEQNVIEETNALYDNERFVTLSHDLTARDVTDNVSVASAKFSLKENMSRGSAHSVKSQRMPSPLQDVRVTPVRTIVASAPTIAYMGSSNSTEEEVKSVESGFSEHSVRESLDSEENDKENGTKVIENIGENVITRKPPKKYKMLSKTVSSKVLRNRIQPTQTQISVDKPYERPKEVLSKSLVQLESCDWETVMSGLRGMDNLVKYHSVFLETHLTPVCRAVAAQIKNLRSQVARAACRLAGNLFLSQRKCIESEADELAVPLLSRTADTNKFLRIDANEALDKMSESISPHKSICIILTRGTVHQNAIVRCTSARLLSNIVKTTGADRIFGIQKDIRDKLIHSGADLLTEGSLETRNHAKQLFKILSQSPLFLRIVRDTIPLSKYRSIEKSLNNIRAQ